MVNLDSIRVYKLLLLLTGYCVVIVNSQILSSFDSNFTAAILTNELTNDYPNISIESLTNNALSLINEYNTASFVDLQTHSSINDETLDTSELNNTEILNTDTTSETIDASQSSYNNPLYSMSILPNNATAWQMLKAQIYADFAPFLILIPKPVKTYILQQSKLILHSIRHILKGIYQPIVSMYPIRMCISSVGYTFIRLGKGLVAYSQPPEDQKNTTTTTTNAAAEAPGASDDGATSRDKSYTILHSIESNSTGSTSSTESVSSLIHTSELPEEEGQVEDEVDIEI